MKINNNINSNILSYFNGGIWKHDVVYVHLIRDLLRIPILCKGIFVVGAQFNMNKVCSWGLFPSCVFGLLYIFQKVLNLQITGIQIQSKSKIQIETQHQLLSMCMLLCVWLKLLVLVVIDLWPNHYYIAQICHYSSNYLDNLSKICHMAICEIGK